MCATETSCFAALQTSFHLLGTGQGYWQSTAGS
jgi:hypothetical protein